MKTKIFYILCILLLSSCSSYFRVLHKDSYTVRSIKQQETEGKYIVLHRGNEAWHAYDLKVVNDSLITSLDYQLGYLINYIHPKEKGLNRYGKNEPDVVNSIHVYTSDTTFNSLDTLIAVPASSIFAVNSYEYAQAATRASKIVPLVFFPVVGTVILITLMIKSVQNIDMSFHI